jgi:hypothetical protein
LILAHGLAARSEIPASLITLLVIVLNKSTGGSIVKQHRNLASLALGFFIVFMVGCAATTTTGGTGEYIDDTVITSKVKLAILKETSLKSPEINVETFKGVVQLSGFVSSKEDTKKAVSLAESVGGVESVSNDMRVK